MANKIKKTLEWYYQRLVEEPCKRTYKEYKAKDEELGNLIYKMWQNDLISDKVKDECYNVLKEYGFKVLKYAI